jgi:flagellar basal-body rod protein FlgC
MMMMDVYDITASAMTAQRLRMDTIAANLANVNTTRNPDGSIGAYRRKSLVFAPLMDKATSQAQDLPLINGNQHIGLSNTSEDSGTGGHGVQVLQITRDDTTPMRMVYDPSHPDSNPEGFVEYPNVNAVTEMVDMISASKAYEASVSAFKSTKSMNEATLQM